MNKRRLLAFLGLAFVLASAGTLSAQTVLTNQAPRVSGNMGPNMGSRSPIDVKAEQMDYDRERGVIVASGNVRVQQADELLQADQVEVDEQSGDVRASGHVVFTRGKDQWRGNELRYNFVTKRWNTGAFVSFLDPFYVRADSSSKLTDTSYVLHNATLTTCNREFPHMHYRVKCRRLVVRPGDRVKGYGTTMFLGPVPFFYLPVWTRSLSDRGSGFSVQPGYRSRMGGYLLGSYKWQFAPQVKSVTHLDYRMERGVAGGEDIIWKDSKQGYRGGLYTYYLDDQGVEDDAENGSRELLDSERYRVKLKHTADLSPRDYLMGEANYLSDPYVLDDFFRKEYRDQAEPENYVDLMHREDSYTADLVVRRRLNDFYSAVNRMPEASIDFSQQPLGESGFYYEGQNSAGYLERQYAEGSEEEDYSALRVDSGHMLYYPTRHFGFLNFIPRAGVEGTYYSKTFDIVEETVVDTVTATNFTVLADGSSNSVVTTETTTGTVSRVDEKGSNARILFELGFETSFKAFRTWDNIGTTAGDGLRHVVEPYARYTLVPEPNLTPEHIYQFDEIDSQGKKDEVRFGARNKLQTKRGKSPFDLVDLDVYTIYRLEPEEGEEDFTDLYADAAIRPTDWFRIDIDGSYNTYESVIDTFNTRFRLTHGMWNFDIEHRYTRDSSSLIAGNLDFTPNKTWSFGTFVRYEAEGSQLEEHGYSVTRTLDCMVVRTELSEIPAYTRSDGSEADAEYRAELQLWLTAFPEVRIGGTGSNQ